MEVYALVGPSGTGKSHRALIVAQERGINTLIDDGLLIQDSRIVAGKSAKREPTRLQAVRRAIFVDPEQAREVKEKLAELAPERVLVISTSLKMIRRILERLELPPPAQVIQIEEIASPQEIAHAREVRRREGKHVIPVPTIEVKKKFPGFLVDPLEVFFPRPSATRSERVGEKSLVRPPFSYVGKLYIADAVIVALVQKCLAEIPGVARPLRTQVRARGNEGVVIELELKLVYGHRLPPLLARVQEEVQERIQYFTGLNVLAVNVLARALQLPEGES
ncbi:MAG: Asp23/Gls24 family envelope stress response protein [bacterium]|jgi:uncharacterized alkaline shock family protein YloU